MAKSRTARTATASTRAERTHAMSNELTALAEDAKAHFTLSQQRSREAAAAFDECANKLRPHQTDLFGADAPAPLPLAAHVAKAVLAIKAERRQWTRKPRHLSKRGEMPRPAEEQGLYETDRYEIRT